MKIDFQNLNIAPTPNPKPLKVERVQRPIYGEHGTIIGHETVFIRNANLDPHVLTGRR